MCVNPVAVGIGLTVGSKIVGAIGGRNQAKQTREEANRAALADKRALVARRSEEIRGMLIEKQETGRELEALKSRVLTQAAEGNVSGISVEMLGMDFEREKGEIESLMQGNVGILRRQVSRQLRGVEATRRSRVNAAQGPNLLALGLDIATGVVGGLGVQQKEDFLNKNLATNTEEVNA